jgi:hypothetical protein
MYTAPVTLTRRRCAAVLASPLIHLAAAQPRVLAVRTPFGGIQPQVLLGSRGTLHLVYFSGDPLAGELFYSTSRDAASWSPAIPVNAPASAIAAGTIRGAQIAAAPDGRVHVAWNGSSAARPLGPLNPDSGKHGMPMLYTRLNDAGTAFQPQRNLMTRTFGLDGGGSIAVGPGGAVSVAWHGIGIAGNHAGLEGEARRQVWIAASTDAGVSFSAEREAWSEPTGACGCCGMKAFADRRGHLYALYRGARESKHRDIYLLHSPRPGAPATGSLLHRWEINACPMSSMELAQGPAGVVAAWETGGQIFWAPVDNPSSPIAAPGDAKGRKHPRLAFNPDGQMLLVWTEGTGWKRGGAFAWQLYDPSGRPTPVSGRLDGVPAWSFASPVAHPGGHFSVFF